MYLASGCMLSFPSGQFACWCHCFFPPLGKDPIFDIVFVVAAAVSSFSWASSERNVFEAHVFGSFAGGRIRDSQDSVPSARMPCKSYAPPKVAGGWAVLLAKFLLRRKLAAIGGAPGLHDA